MLQKLLTVSEVAKILRLSELTVYKYIRSNDLEAAVFGGHYRIAEDALENFIKKQKHQLTETEATRE